MCGNVDRRRGRIGMRERGWEDSKGEIMKGGMGVGNE